jgi:hypothetical protein
VVWVGGLCVHMHNHDCSDDGVVLNGAVCSRLNQQVGGPILHCMETNDRDSAEARTDDILRQ